MLLRHGKSLRRAGAPSPLLSPVTSTCATRHRTRPSDCLCSLPSDPTWTAPGASSTKMKYQVISNHTYSGSPIFFSKDRAILESKHKAKRRSHGDDRDRKFHSSRCLMLLENSHKLYSTDELLSYIKSTFSELEGSNHCWFNMNAAIPSFDEKNIFLILIGAFLPNSTSLCRRKEIILFERVKMLQKIYPYLPVFGFQSCESKSSVHTQALVTSTIAEEYANFPVLLSDSFPKLPNEPCCLLLGGSGSHVKFDPDVDIQMIAAEIDKHSKLLCPESSQSLDVNEAQRNVVKALEVLKGFHSCSSFKNVLLNFPGCVSADGSGDRLFISDTNHHRIIICDSHGKIIDCIGSFPGYMDGGFESAQMHRPAASVYHADEDCLYFVDCEESISGKKDCRYFISSV